jgi:hypothetical protein
MLGIFVFMKVRPPQGMVHIQRLGVRFRTAYQMVPGARNFTNFLVPREPVEVV